MERVPDGDFPGKVASVPGQNDDVGVLEQSQDWIGEPDRQQPLPIDPEMLGLEFEFAGKLNQSRDGQCVTVEDVAPTSSRNGRIEAVSHPQPSEASQRRVAGGHRFQRSF
jgi:hypothetical protein